MSGHTRRSFIGKGIAGLAFSLLPKSAHAENRCSTDILEFAKILEGYADGNGYKLGVTKHKHEGETFDSPHFYLGINGGGTFLNDFYMGRVTDKKLGIVQPNEKTIVLISEGGFPLEFSLHDNNYSSDVIILGNGQTGPSSTHPFGELEMKLDDLNLTVKMKPDDNQLAKVYKQITENLHW